MKVLLTRPWNHTSMLIPNHGLGYLSSALKSKGHQAVIVDCIRDRMDAERFGRYIRDHEFDLIGFQIYTFDLEIVSSYLKQIPAGRPFVIAGGPHPSADPSGLMARFDRFDFCFAGEAETGLPMLADTLDTSRRKDSPELTRIPGLCYRDSGSDLRCNPALFEPDLDVFGYPDWEQISPLSYPVAPQGTFTRKLPFAPIIITRGCPYPCTFCAGKIISGTQVRTRSIPHVVDEIKFLKKTYGIREFHIQDDNFTFRKEYVLGFCDALLQADLNLAWACPNGIRLDTIDREMLKSMETAGCYSVAVGIESGTQRVLDLMKKKTTLDELVYKVNLIRSTTRWFITGFFILGYPGETRQEMLETVQLSMRLPIDKVNYGILMPLPGTEAAQAARDCGWDLGDLAGRMSEYRSSFTPPGVTPAEFRSIFRNAFIRFYARPRIVWRFIRQIQSLDQFRILIRRFWDVVSP